jgi:serine/threonine protein kinase
MVPNKNSILVENTQLKQYLIQQKIGGGSFGEVYLVFETNQKIKVAVKAIRESLFKT